MNRKNLEVSKQNDPNKVALTKENTIDVLEIANKISKRGQFELVETYYERDILKKRIIEINPKITNKESEMIIPKNKNIYVLIIINSKNRQFNIFSETDILTLEDLLARLQEKEEQK